jgi:hypothetical protein
MFTDGGGKSIAKVLSNFGATWLSAFILGIGEVVEDLRLLGR